MKHVWLWGSIGSLVLVVVLGVTWWVLSAAGVFAVSTEPPAPSAVPGEASAAVAALELLETDPAALLPESLAAELGPEIDSALPEGATISADPDSWQPSTLGGGLLDATITYADGTVEQLVVAMTKEEEQWKVLTTFPGGGGQ